MVNTSAVGYMRTKEMRLARPQRPKREGGGAEVWVRCGVGGVVSLVSSARASPHVTCTRLTFKDEQPVYLRFVLSSSVMRWRSISLRL